jgi:hypothetical protein
MILIKKDWLILVGLYFITIIPLFLRLFFWGQQNYFNIVFFSGFIPVFATHSTSLGLRFRNYYFSGFWLLMIGINGFMYSKIIPIWIAMVISFTFYHALRYAFLIITRKEPIPLFVGPGSKLDFNTIENRMEDKTDLIFTLFSFFFGLAISIGALMLTK